MIDIGWTELLFLAVILIVVVGPKDLPMVLRAFGQAARKVRTMADEFRRGVDDFIRESELKELSDGVEQIRNFDLQRLKAESGKPASRSESDSTGATIPSSANEGSNGQEEKPEEKVE